jgi:NAD(P)-dependent dehydrogenase (short-subunit alcohol dehydrogenase family)
MTASEFSGKVALVTGGSRGLGRAIAEALSAAGAEVIIASRKPDGCERVAAEIAAQTSGKVHGLGCHVGHWDSVETLVERSREVAGQIDILVNNTGMSPLYDRLDSVTEELWDKVVAINLKGPFRLSALVGQDMVVGRGGVIINISSIAAIRPRAHTVPYSAAKAGLNAITVGCAHALGPRVRVNAVMAGPFLTDVSTSWDEETTMRLATYALGRAGYPEEVVGAVMYLASDVAASFTTGTILQVDGGTP